MSAGKDRISVDYKVLRSQAKERIASDVEGVNAMHSFAFGKIGSRFFSIRA